MKESLGRCQIYPMKNMRKETYRIHFVTAHQVCTSLQKGIPSLFTVINVPAKGVGQRSRQILCHQVDINLGVLNETGLRHRLILWFEDLTRSKSMAISTKFACVAM